MVDETMPKAPSLLQRMRLSARHHSESRVVGGTQGGANKELKHRGNSKNTRNKKLLPG